jgi:hypothetical protein
VSQLAELKKDILRLLKEDEEFRYAVAGLIGLEEILRRLDRNESELVKLREDFNRHLELEEKRWEEERKRWEENNKRWEENNRRWEENNIRWGEAYRRFEAIEDTLRNLTDTVRNLSVEVAKLSDAVGFGLEDIARTVLPGWLYRHEGIIVEELVRESLFVEGEEIEVNLFGVGSKDSGKMYIVGECKSRIYKSDVEDFTKRLEKVRRVLRDGEVYPLMFGYYIHHTAQKIAIEKGVKLVASYMR